jgi:hypothetical protein
VTRAEGPWSQPCAPPPRDVAQRGLLAPPSLAGHTAPSHLPSPPPVLSHPKRVQRGRRLRVIPGLGGGEDVGYKIWHLLSCMQVSEKEVGIRRRRKKTGEENRRAWENMVLHGQVNIDRPAICTKEAYKRPCRNFWSK